MPFLYNLLGGNGIFFSVYGQNRLRRAGKAIGMTNYDYLILGGGMTAAAAAQAIREVDANGSIGIISAEDHPPYNRPPLTKKLWLGKPEDSIWRDLPKDNFEIHTNCRVTLLDPKAKHLEDESGKTYTYQRLLLATGGTPRQLPFGKDEILYYRTLNDYHQVRGWTGKGGRFGIIGGGFIGSELAAALAANHEQVVMAFPEAGIGAAVYPADLSDYVTGYFRQKDVTIHCGVSIEGIQRIGNRQALKGKDGLVIEVDHIIAGIGIRPNIDLAQAAGVVVAGSEAGGGITVDEYLRTNLPDVYAAGDVASFYNPALQRQMRVEHEDNANSMGRAAGLNMAGRQTAYHHQPYFYSDLFDLGYEAVGELSSRMETYSDWKVPFREGVVYYLKDNKVRGVLLWNTWDQVEAARNVIASGKTYQPEDLKGLLPEKK